MIRVVDPDAIAALINGPSCEGIGTQPRLMERIAIGDGLGSSNGLCANHDHATDPLPIFLRQRAGSEHDTSFFEANLMLKVLRQ